jgi:hypothetical protein
MLVHGIIMARNLAEVSMLLYGLFIARNMTEVEHACIWYNHGKEHDRKLNLLVYGIIMARNMTGS